MSLEMLAKVEQGKKAPSASNLRKLATALGMEPTDLASRAAWWELNELEGASGSLLRLGVTQWLAGGARLPHRGRGGALGAAAVAVPLIGTGVVGAVAGAAVAKEFANRRALAAWLRKQANLVTEGSAHDVEQITQELGFALRDSQGPTDDDRPTDAVTPPL
jgi:hypothetical protein